MTEETPEPYRTWLQAINDTLDEQVDETQYDNEIIQRMFEHIEQDSVTPQERARMFDEYGQEQLRRDEYKLGVAEAKLETARKMLAKGYDLAEVAELTGLSPDELAQLS